MKYFIRDQESPYEISLKTNRPELSVCMLVKILPDHEKVLSDQNTIAFMYKPIYCKDMVSRVNMVCIQHTCGNALINSLSEDFYSGMKRMCTF